MKEHDKPDILSSEEQLNIVKQNKLSSACTDKCPYVINCSYNDNNAVVNMIIFASDRPGGFGSWNDPVNFGDKINTEYDEYRPIFKRINGFNNDIMIFPSNKPGGFGGFDLYYVGIDIAIGYDKILPVEILNY